MKSKRKTPQSTPAPYPIKETTYEAWRSDELAAIVGDWEANLPLYTRYVTKNGKPRHSPLYAAYYNLVQRCTNPQSPRWHGYGGRGISVDPSWLGDNGFENFVDDMGPRPSIFHSIDRIDNDGPYSPNNCKWATREEQNANRGRRTKAKIKKSPFVKSDRDFIYKNLTTAEPYYFCQIPLQGQTFKGGAPKTLRFGRFSSPLAAACALERFNQEFDLGLKLTPLKFHEAARYRYYDFTKKLSQKALRQLKGA